MSLAHQVARMPAWQTDEYKTTLPDEFTTGPASIWVDPNPSGLPKAYMLVQFADAITYAAGQCVILEAADNYVFKTVTNDFSAGEGIAAKRIPIGVCLGVPTEDQYGWVQIAGAYASASMTSSVAAHVAVGPGAETGADGKWAALPESATEEPWQQIEFGAWTTAAESSDLADIIIIPSPFFRAYL